MTMVTMTKCSFVVRDATVFVASTPVESSCRRDLATDRQTGKAQSSVPLHAARRAGEPVLHVPQSFFTRNDTHGDILRDISAWRSAGAAHFRETFYGGNNSKSQDLNHVYTVCMRRLPTRSTEELAKFQIFFDKIHPGDKNLYFPKKDTKN